EAVAIEFEDATVETNVNNKIEWNVVDAEGNAVELTNVAATVIKYVVLDKPADAKVSVVDRTGANFDGDGEMSLTSNKVGNVTVQVIAQVTFGSEDANENSLVAKQTKYYTGTEIFAVGNGQVGDVVVMSIGSNEIVINDAKATIDAAPIVQNDRTFVPFRALAEAFGAEVAWDEATQAVTAELNGVTVVMTIGSVEYTINGEAATMDVAPFLGNDSTMVPVRFVAQAFGIKVIPTYDANGATADILFNL
ncbi:MAG: copper amine oxidase N-terminal domain-containing protein, partial [Peptococcaceae bacterium]|nr:copper amine oxidase N-terminal domain-containing protein [Peptococcaceae bacterium]